MDFNMKMKIDIKNFVKFFPQKKRLIFGKSIAFLLLFYS